MFDEGRVLEVVSEAICVINEDLTEEEQVSCELSSELVSKNGSSMDSLTLILFIGEVEERMEKDLSITLDLADEKFMTMEQSPLETVGKLVEYICRVARSQFQAA